jgi:hypothetical protein
VRVAEGPLRASRGRSSRTGSSELLGDPDRGARSGRWQAMLEMGSSRSPSSERAAERVGGAVGRVRCETTEARGRRPFPLKGTPWFDAERWWVSPMNFARRSTRDCRSASRSTTSRCGTASRPGRRVPARGAGGGRAGAFRPPVSDRIEVGMPAVSPEVAAGCAAVAELGLSAELVGFARAIPGGRRGVQGRGCRR